MVVSKNQTLAQATITTTTMMMMKTPSILLLALCFVASLTNVAASTGECEVCIKVLDDIKNTMTKDQSRNKPAIEQAIGAYCAGTSKLNSREKKICYYIDPIKRDVAQPFSLGMPNKKVCERINKSNPEICTVKMPVKTEKMEKKDISKLRVKQLKKILADRGVECKGCVEKDEFVKRVQDTEHLASDEF